MEQFLAATANNKTLTLWSVSSHQSTAILRETMNEVGAVAFSPNGTLLATGTMGQITLWNASSHEALAVLTGHTSSIFSVAFSPDARFIVSASADKRIRLKGDCDTTGDQSAHGTFWVRQFACVQSRWKASCLRRVSHCGAVARSTDQAMECGQQAVCRHAHRPCLCILRILHCIQPEWTIACFSGGSDKTIRLWDLTLLKTP